MKNDDSRVNELTIALQHAEQKIAEREALVTAALSQTEAARAQYEHAQERLETLRRRLDAQDQQIGGMQQELLQRDERIAALEQLCVETDNALNAINQDLKFQDSASPSARLAGMGLVLESLDEPGVLYRITRVTTTIGRAIGNDIAINSVSVSRYHSRIVVGSDSTYLIDLQSTNGCSVNGQRVSRQNINDGDVIGIGKAKFRFAAGVQLADIEDRSFDETHTLLDDSVIFSPAPKLRSDAKSDQGTRSKAEEK